VATNPLIGYNSDTLKNTVSNRQTTGKVKMTNDLNSGAVEPIANRSQALYRKWRSQTFGELVGQEAITRTLKNAISSQRIGHAYLFCGPRGTGKTSTARLLAKAVNCLDSNSSNRPCNQCEPCLSIAEGRAVDLIEIDAASNNGVDNVRDLREKITTRPAQLKKKVYIIDEVHMLTDSAFNALLKTLEEPPPHAMFILATTDPQDIPATVVSRCQRFDFQRIKLDTIADRMAFVCQQEDISFDQTALEMLARQSTGSLRDALSLLDQIIVFSGGVITVEAVQAMLGVSNHEAIAAFTTALVSGDLAQGLEQINKLVQSGSDLKRFNRELVDYLRGIMLVKANPNSGELLNLTSEALTNMREQANNLALPGLVNLLKVFSNVDYSLKVSPYAQLPLELALMEAVLQQPEDRPRPVASTPPVSRPSSTPVPPRPTPVEVKPSAPPVREQPAPALITKSEPVKEPVAPVAPVTQNISDDKNGFELEAVTGVWRKFMDSVATVEKTTHALLLEARPVAVKGNQVTLAFKWAFHREKISTDKKRLMVEEHLSKVLGQAVIVRCVPEEGYDNSVKAEANSKITNYARMMNATVREIN
jgi:DNA polymerase III subunit gamma/tau